MLRMKRSENKAKLKDIGEAQDPARAAAGVEEQDAGAAERAAEAAQRGQEGAGDRTCRTDSDQSHGEPAIDEQSGKWKLLKNTE